MGQLHDHPDQRGVFWIPHPGDEAPVDLDGVDRQAVEVGQRRVPGPKIIDGDFDPEPANFVELPGHNREVVEEHGLGDLDRELAGVGPG
jgi:hypothetical protein